MAIHRLNPNRLPTAAGLHGDGNGLFLEVRATGARYWLFRYNWQGGKKKMFHPTMLLTRLEEWCVEAETAEQARELLASGEGQACHNGDCTYVDVERFDDAASPPVSCCGRPNLLCLSSLGFQALRVGRLDLAN